MAHVSRLPLSNVDDLRISRTAPTFAWCVSSASVLVAYGISRTMAGYLRAWWMLLVLILILKFLVLTSVGWKVIRSASIPRLIGFVLLWPGMRPMPFLDNGRCLSRVHGGSFFASQWAWPLAGVTNFVAGLVLLWLAVRHSMAFENDEIRAMLGLMGAALIVLFGLFQLLAVAWRRRGVHVERQWHFLFGARSLGEYWSVRWNRAFHDFAREQIYRPLRRQFSAGIALMGTFLFSGLAHELVISVPAGGGYGRPTLYFLIQGIGIVIERQFLHPGWRRQAWAGTVLLLPIALLLHERFLAHVVLPQLEALSWIFVN